SPMGIAPAPAPCCCSAADCRFSAMSSTCGTGVAASNGALFLAVPDNHIGFPAFWRQCCNAQRQAGSPAAQAGCDERLVAGLQERSDAAGTFEERQEPEHGDRDIEEVEGEGLDHQVGAKDIAHHEGTHSL